MKRLVLVVVLVVAVALAAARPLAAFGAVGGPPASVRVTLAPRLPAGATEIGAVPSSADQTAEVVLRPRDHAALTSFIAAVTDAQSPLFHHYLARDQFATRFGPAEATIDAVRAQLQADGLQVTSVASDGLVIDVRAATAQMERAFGTSLERVRLAGGQIGQVTMGAVRLPSAIAGAVTAVVGLNSVVRLQPLGLVRNTASGRATHPAAKAPSFSHPAGSATACADARAGAQKFGGLTDDQIANAYGGFGLYGAGDLGGGAHIAVYELRAVPAVGRQDVRHVLLRRPSRRADGRAAERDPGRWGPASWPGVRRVDSRRRGHLGHRAGTRPSTFTKDQVPTSTEPFMTR